MNPPFKFSICFRQVPPVRARRSREPPRPHAQQQLPEVAAVRAGEAVPAAGERHCFGKCAIYARNYRVSFVASAIEFMPEHQYCY